MQTFIKMMKEFLEMLFPWNNKDNSRSHAKNRLQLIIAHDRASINPDLLEAMREEILDVVARYVEVDREEMEFSLSNDQRITALTANLPIRQIRRAGELQEQVKNNSSLELQTAEVETVTKTEKKPEGKN